MPDTLIDCYRAVESESDSMLEAARRQAWPEVRHREVRCRELIEQLQHHAQTLRLEADEPAEKAHIMQRILRNDAKVRLLAEPALARYESMFEPTRLQVPED